MTDTRRADLAKIHLGAKQLGMDDATRRDMMWTVARVRSAKDLDEAGRRQVIEHLRSRGARFHQRGRPKPAQGRDALVRKIRAQLATAERTDAYADGMARKMFGVDRFEWCEEDQLKRIAAALYYDAKRHGRKTR